MSDDLLKKRVELAKKYQEANDALQAATIECSSAKEHILAFDAEHPAVMEAVKKVANDRRREDGNAKAAAAREAAEVDEVITDDS